MAFPQDCVQWSQYGSFYGAKNTEVCVYETVKHEGRSMLDWRVQCGVRNMQLVELKKC
jgi:hypothetical protein